MLPRAAALANERSSSTNRSTEEEGHLPQLASLALRPGVGRRPVHERRWKGEAGAHGTIGELVALPPGD
eukprot:3320415-Prymnesium_polylepis.1